MIFKVLKSSIPGSEYQCSIVIDNSHNHPTNSLHATSFRPILQETKEAIFMLFDSGMTSSQAYAEFIQKLKKGLGLLK